MKNVKELFKSPNEIKEYFKSPRMILWLIICLITLFNVVFIFVVTFIDTNEFLPSGKPMWKEYLHTFFYVTNIGSFMGAIFLVMFLFTNINQESKWWRRFKICTSTSLTLIVLLYWTILAKDHIPGITDIDLARSIFTHGIVPLTIVGLIIYEDVFTVGKVTKTADTKETWMFNGLVPILWILIQIILYYAMGPIYGHNAMYGFLDFNNQSILSSILAILGVTIFFILLTMIFSYLHNIEYTKNK